MGEARDFFVDVCRTIARSRVLVLATHLGECGVTFFGGGEPVGAAPVCTE
jgi:hypothetical protein